MDEIRPMGPKARATICWSKLGLNDSITPRFPKLQQRSSKLKIQGQMSTIVEETYAVFNPRKIDKSNPKIRQKFVVNRISSNHSTTSTSAATSNDVDSITLGSSRHMNVCLPIFSSSTSEVQEMHRNSSKIKLSKHQQKCKELITKMSSNSINKKRSKWKNKEKVKDITTREDIKERRPSILQCIISDILKDDKKHEKKLRKIENKDKSRKRKCKDDSDEKKIYKSDLKKMYTKDNKMCTSDSADEIVSIKGASKKHCKKKQLVSLCSGAEGDMEKPKKKQKNDRDGKGFKDSLKNLTGFKKNKHKDKSLIDPIKPFGNFSENLNKVSKCKMHRVLLDDDCVYRCEFLPCETKPKPTFKLSDLGSLEIPPFKPKDITAVNYSIESIKMILDATSASSHSLVPNVSCLYCEAQEYFPRMNCEYDCTTADVKTIELRSIVNALNDKSTNTDITWVEKKFSRIPRLKNRKKKRKFEGRQATNDSESSRGDSRHSSRIPISKNNKFRNHSGSQDWRFEQADLKQIKMKVKSEKLICNDEHLSKIKDIAEVTNLEEEAIVFSDDNSCQDSKILRNNITNEALTVSIPEKNNTKLEAKGNSNRIIDCLEDSTTFLTKTNSLLSILSLKKTNSVSLQVFIPSKTVETNTSFSTLVKTKKHFTKSKLPLPIKQYRCFQPDTRRLTFPIELDIRKLLEGRRSVDGFYSSATNFDNEIRKSIGKRLYNWFSLWKRAKRKLNVELTLSDYQAIASIEGRDIQMYYMPTTRPDISKTMRVYHPVEADDNVSVHNDESNNSIKEIFDVTNSVIIDMSFYVFTSILRKYLMEDDSLKMFVPCYVGYNFKAPKYMEYMLRNPDPILESVSSITCELEMRRQRASQLVIAAKNNDNLEGISEGIELRRLSEHDLLVDFDINMDYIYEIPYNSNENMLLIGEQALDSSDFKLSFRHSRMDEDFTLLLEPTPSEIVLVISFIDNDIILILPDSSTIFSSYNCHITSSDVVYDLFNELFDILKKNKSLVRNMHRILMSSRKTIECSSINSRTKEFVSDVWDAVIKMNKDYILDAKKVLNLTIKYRHTYVESIESLIQLKNISFKSIFTRFRRLKQRCHCRKVQKSSSCPCLRNLNKVKKKRSKSQGTHTKADIVTLFFTSIEKNPTSDESSSDHINYKERSNEKHLIEYKQAHNNSTVNSKVLLLPNIDLQITYIINRNEVIDNPPILWILAKRFLRNRRNRIEERQRLLHSRRKRQSINKISSCEENKSYLWSIMSQSSFLTKTWSSMSKNLNTLTDFFNRSDLNKEMFNIRSKMNLDCLCNKSVDLLIDAERNSHGSTEMEIPHREAIGYKKEKSVEKYKKNQNRSSDFPHNFMPFLSHKHTYIEPFLNGKTKIRQVITANNDNQRPGPSGIELTKVSDSNHSMSIKSQILKPARQVKCSYHRSFSCIKRNTSCIGKQSSNDNQNIKYQPLPITGPVFMLSSDIPLHKIDSLLRSIINNGNQLKNINSTGSDSLITCCSHSDKTPNIALELATNKSQSLPELTTKASDLKVNKYIRKSKEVMQTILDRTDDQKFNIKTIFQKKCYLKKRRKEFCSSEKKKISNVSLDIKKIITSKSNEPSCKCSIIASKLKEDKQIVHTGTNAIHVQLVSIGVDPIGFGVVDKSTMTLPEPFPTQIPNMDASSRRPEYNSLKTINVIHPKKSKSRWKCLGKKLATVEKRTMPCTCIDLNALVNDMVLRSDIVLKKIKREEGLHAIYCNRMVENVAAQVYHMDFGKDAQCQACFPRNEFAAMQSDSFLIKEKFAREIEKRICQRIKCWKNTTISTRDSSVGNSTTDIKIGRKANVKHFDRVSFESDSIFKQDTNLVGVDVSPNIGRGHNGSNMSSIMTSAEYLSHRRLQGSTCTKTNLITDCDCTTGTLKPSDICTGKLKKKPIRNDSISVLKNKIQENKSVAAISKRRFIPKYIKNNLKMTPYFTTTSNVMPVSATFPKRVKLQSISTSIDQLKIESPKTSMDVVNSNSMMNISDILGSDDLVADNSQFSLSRSDSNPVKATVMPTGPITMDSQVDVSLPSKTKRLDYVPYNKNTNMRPNREKKNSLAIAVSVGDISKTDSERQRNARGAKLADHMDFDCTVIKKPPKRTPSYEARAERGSIIADTLNFDTVECFGNGKASIKFEVQESMPQQEETSMKRSFSRFVNQMRSSMANLKRNVSRSVSLDSRDKLSVAHSNLVAKNDDMYPNAFNHDRVKGVHSMVQVQMSSDELFMEIKPFSEIKQKPEIKPAVVKNLTPSPPMNLRMKSVDSLELYPKDESGKRHSKVSKSSRKVSFKIIANIKKIFTRRKGRVSFSSVQVWPKKISHFIPWFRLSFGKKTVYGCGADCTCGPEPKDVCFCKRTTQANYVHCICTGNKHPFTLTRYKELLSCNNQEIKIEVDDAFCILPSNSDLCSSRLPTILEKSEKSSKSLKSQQKPSERTINSDIPSLKFCDVTGEALKWKNTVENVNTFKNSYDKLRPFLLENVSRESERYIFNKICTMIVHNSCPSIRSLYQKPSNEIINNGLKKAKVVSLLKQYSNYEEDETPFKFHKYDISSISSTSVDSDELVYDGLVFSVRNYTERKTNITEMESSPKRGNTIISLDDNLKPKVS